MPGISYILIYHHHHITYIPSIMSGLGKHIQYSDLLWAGWSENRILVGRDFMHPSRADLRPPPQPHIQWGPCLSQGVKWPGHGIDHPPLSSAKVKERVELYIYSPSRPSWPVIGLTLSLPYHQL